MEDTLERDYERDRVHVHVYQTEAEVAGKNKHQHLIMGVSHPAHKEGRSHVHRLEGYTSYYTDDKCECGHWHVIDVCTECAMEACEDGHVHCFSGMTSMNDGHCHRFIGVTGLGPMECEEEEYEECPPHYHEDDCAMPMHYKKKKYEMEDECCEEMPMPCKKKKHEMEDECCEEMPMPYKKKKHEMEDMCCESMPMMYKKKKKREE